MATAPGDLGRLLRQLTAAHVGDARADKPVRAAARLLDSSLTAAPGLQSVDALVRAMLTRLMRAGRHADATRLATLAAGLRFETAVVQDALWPLLYVLSALRGSAAEAPQGGMAALRIGEAGVEEDHAGGGGVRMAVGVVNGLSAGRQSRDVVGGDADELPFVSRNPFQPGDDPVVPGAKRSSSWADVDRGVDSVDVESVQQRQAPANGVARADSSSFSRRAAVRPGRHNAALEQMLVRDLLLIVQGEDGKYVRFVGEGRDEVVKITLPEGATPSPPVYDIVMYTAELGFLFRVIRARVDSAQDGTGGLVWQNMCSAVLCELDAFYRSLVALRGPLDADSSDELTGERALTLRRIFVWAEGEKPRLRWLARLCDETANLVGGQILAHLRSYRSTYFAPEIHDMMSRILTRTAAPLNRMLARWVTEGVLADPHGEFFIIEDPKVAAAAAAAAASSAALMEESGASDSLAGGPNAASTASNRIWWGLFKIRREMLPGAQEQGVVEKTLVAGKSVAFLRRCCADSAWVNQFHAPALASLLTQGQRLLEANRTYERDGISELVEAATESASKRLKSLFFDKFDLSHHFAAIKQYLLLSQGDFTQALMDTLAPILDGDGRILRNNLTGFVDAALQGASSFNAQTDKDILERLDVQIIPQNGESCVGWDVFSLTYRVEDAPLNTVFSGKVMDAYLLIFRFLWRLKRMDHLLSSSYMGLCEYEGSGRLQNFVEGVDLETVAQVLKRAHFIRMKMTHLVQNMQHYCTVEVLEGTWTVLERDMAGAADLDSLIQAHSRYLTAIKDRTLLSERSKPVADALHAILEVIPRFHRTQRELTSWLDQRVVGSRRRTRERSSFVGWGNSDEVREQPAGSPMLVTDFVEILARVELDFDSHFSSFLDALCKHAKIVDSCMFLVFRLDFNKYFERRREAMADSTASEALRDLE